MKPGRYNSWCSRRIHDGFHKILTWQPTRSLGTKRSQEKTLSFLPVGPILTECPIRILADIENVLGPVEFDDDGWFSVRSGCAEDVGGPVHGWSVVEWRKVRSPKETANSAGSFSET